MGWHTGLILLATLLSVAQPTAGAEEQERVDPKVEKKLTSNNPNYFVVAVPTQDGELDDDVHLEFYVSVQYPMYARKTNPHNLFFIYNGLYDFYIVDDTRYKSAPIISRRQNPGLVYEYNDESEGKTRKSYRVGYFHESNGQTLESSDGQAAFDDQVAQHGKEYALAQVSRGWDYLDLRYRSADMKVSKRWENRFDIELRTYMPKQMFKLNREDDIFWEPVDEQPKIRDYDGLRFMYEILEADDSDLNFILRLDLKTGISDSEALGNFSYRVSAFGRVTIPWIEVTLPLTAFYFNGYGKEPSTYNERTEYIGIGFQFR